MNSKTLTTYVAAVAAALLAAAPPAAAADQVAVVASSSHFQLRGAKVAPNQGVPSWPVMAGDLVNAGDAPAAVSFSDGSGATLERGTLVRLDRSGRTPVLQLVCGTVRYSLKSADAVKLMSQNGPLVPAKLTGTFSMCSDRSAAGWWSTGHTAMVMGAVAGGAVAAYSIATAISGGPCVSPTNCGCASCSACGGGSR